MKILITSDWYIPAVNGVVTSVKNLRRELEARGHEVRVLTLSQNHRSYKREGVTYLGSVAAGLIYPGARLRTALAGKWVREIVEWEPDVVHSQCEFSTFFLARRIAEELDIPLVHTYHTVYEDYTHYFSPSVHFGKKAAAVFTRWAASHTDCLIAPTAKVRMLLQGYGVRKPVFVVPSGIDLRHFQQEPDPLQSAVLRASLDIPQDRTVLVFVGRLAEEKRVDELLRFRADLGRGSLMPRPWRRACRCCAGRTPASWAWSGTRRTAGSTTARRSSARDWRASWPIPRTGRPCPAVPGRPGRNTPPSVSRSGWRPFT